MNQRYLCAMQEAAVDTVQFLVSDSVGFVSGLDSVMAIEIEPPVVSLFEGHILQDQHHYAYENKVDQGNTFMFGILFICAAIIVYLQRSSEGVFTDVLKASFDMNLANQDARIENAQRSRNMLLIQVISAISIAVFITGVLLKMIGGSPSVSSVFFKVFWSLVAFVLLKRIVLWFLALLFDLHSELRLHRFNLSILFGISGLILLPLSLLLFYSPQIPFNAIIYVGSGIGLLFYIKGLQRGFSIALSSVGISALHLFYYLCALEILPAFVLIRLAQNM